MSDRTIPLAAGAVILALVTACDDRGSGSGNGLRPVELETRTFTLNGVDTEEAANIIDAYVYRDRPGSPGGMSADRNMISVRETPDNLDRIARVIAELNAAGASPDEYVLHFQLVEANGTTETDPRIADIEAELKRLLRFDGYRLLGETFVTTAGGAIAQRIPVADRIRGYSVEGRLESGGSSRTGPGLRVFSATRELSLALSIGTEERRPDGGSRSGSGYYLSSTVHVREGQTIVIGSAQAPDVWTGDNDRDGEPGVQPGAHVILVLRVSRPPEGPAPATAVSGA